MDGRGGPARVGLRRRRAWRREGGGEDLEIWVRGDVCGGEGATWSKPGKGRRMGDGDRAWGGMLRLESG
jgi:hypothetical protein